MADAELPGAVRPAPLGGGLFTVSFMLATRQHWAVAAIAIAGALWFDLKVTPNALDLRLDDREFVRKIYDLEVFETDITKEGKKIVAVTTIAVLSIFLASILRRFFVAYSNIIMVNKHIFYVIIGIISLFYIALFVRINPIYNIPHPKKFKDGIISLKDWRYHGYEGSGYLSDFTLPLMLVVMVFIISITDLTMLNFSTKQDTTINDYVIFSYTAFGSVAGFCVPIAWNRAYPVRTDTHYM